LFGDGFKNVIFMSVANLGPQALGGRNYWLL